MRIRAMSQSLRNELAERYSISQSIISLLIIKYGASNIALIENDMKRIYNETIKHDNDNNRF